MSTIDWQAIRADFPILHREVHGKPLVYLDSANTAQKPEAVIQAVDDFYRNHNANVSRAVHQLGSEATEAAVLEALQNAYERSTTTMRERMEALTGGLDLNLPGLGG